MEHWETNSNQLPKTCEPSFLREAEGVSGGLEDTYVAIGLAAINWGSWKKQLNPKSPQWEPAIHRVQLWITPLGCLSEMGVWRRNMPLNRWNYWFDQNQIWNNNPKWKLLLLQSIYHNCSLTVLHQRRLVSYSTPCFKCEWWWNQPGKKALHLKETATRKRVRNHSCGRNLPYAKIKIPIHAIYI